MSPSKNSTGALQLLPASRLKRIGRRLRRGAGRGAGGAPGARGNPADPGNRRRRGAGEWLRGAWQRLLEMPWVWVAFLLAIGSLSLAPGTLLLRSLGAPRLAAGSVAGRDYVASRDVMMYDAPASRAKQAQARDRVLPVYDFDPGVLALRDGQIATLFAAGRARLPAARTEADRVALARDLAAGSGGGASDAEQDAARLDALAAGSGQAASADPATAAPTAPAPSAAASASREALRIAEEQAMVLVHKDFAPELEDRLRGLLAQALRRGVVENKALLLEDRMTGILLRNLADGAETTDVTLFDHLGYPEEAHDFLEAEVRSWSGLAPHERRALVALLLANLSPNLHLNRSETLTRRDLAAASAGLVFTQVRRGQIIARKGDVIDEARAGLLAEMRGRRSSRSRLPELAATLLLIGLAAAALWCALAGERVAGHSHRRLFAESVLLLGTALAGARLGVLIAGRLSASIQVAPFDSWTAYAFAVPFAALALTAALLLGRHAALALAVVFSLLAGRLAISGEAALWLALYALGGSLAAIFAMDRLQFRHRLVMPRAGLAVGGVNALVALIAFALAFPETAPLALGFQLLCALAGGLLAAAAASFAVPILEALLGITTDIKLVELSNTNLPLLRRLAFEAPGTFQHSLMVANLAKEGCEAIGADAVLAYAGALYHDIGKVFRPEYFIENQRPGQNRHDHLAPSMSVLVLVSHVKEGAELARQHHLPQVILDAIEQHHGTRLMRFFYNRALEHGEHDPAPVREEDFRYPGPRPRNKVMGVLMLADGVEAASRTLVEPNPAKLRGLIATLLDDCLRDGQLDKTDLTLADLRAMSEAFVRVLSTIFHQRVDYPGFDFNAAPTSATAPGGAGTAAAAASLGGRPPRRLGGGAARAS